MTQARISYISAPGNIFFYCIAILVIVLPRLARILYPELIIEDDFYLQNAFLVSVGEQPYKEFTLNHFPFLEFMLAGLLRLFDSPLIVAEAVTQLFVSINSLAILIIGTHLRDKPTGIFAAALYACSALIFKYHVFEREIFASTFILAGLCCWIFMRKNTTQAIITGLLFFIASLIKLTCIVPFAAIVFWAFTQKRYRHCYYLLVSYTLSLIGCTIIFFALYGQDFFFQVYIFHFMKGYRSLAGRIGCFVINTDFTVFLGMLGFLFFHEHNKHGNWRLIKLLLIAYPVFFICFSSTVWPHNLIEMLIFAALLGGAFLSDIIKWIPSSAQCMVRAKIFAPRPLIIGTAITAVFLFSKPWEIEGARKKLNNYYGFGSIPREEIKAAADFIKKRTQPHDYICCPVPLLAFASSRKKIINYWESFGVEAWLQERIAVQGILKSHKEIKKIRFVELIGKTSSGHAHEAFRTAASLKKPVLIIKPDFRGEEPFAAKLALGIIDEYSGAVVFQNRFFEITEFKPRETTDE